MHLVIIIIIINVNFQKGKIPLLLAVESGNQSMCRELLGSQAADQLRATTPDGDTALHLATRRRDIDMVRILVDYGAAIDLQNVNTRFLHRKITLYLKILIVSIIIIL